MRRNEEILEEAEVEPIAMVMRMRRLEWFGHDKRIEKTENIRAVTTLNIIYLNQSILLCEHDKQNKKQ